MELGQEKTGARFVSLTSRTSRSRGGDLGAEASGCIYIDHDIPLASRGLNVDNMKIPVGPGLVVGMHFKVDLQVEAFRECQR
jgi:hypothetical protein